MAVNSFLVALWGRGNRENGVSLSPVEDVIAAIGRGEMVVVTDDENRENEGDLIMAAEKVTAASINMMVTHARGLVCVALATDEVERLGLRRMPARGDGDHFGTAFLESVDAVEDNTTGISAHDRAATVRKLIDPLSSGRDFVSPGHTFPLEAVPGGVLRRAGHTETAVDLARLSGLRAAGVICEILRTDGEMMRGEELKGFAAEHGLLMTSVADLIAYRQRSENVVEFIRSAKMPTSHGDFELKIYGSHLDDDHHVALILGDPARAESALVRVHSECLTGDVFGSLRCDCGNQLSRALEMIGEEGAGVLLYMRQEGRGIGLANKIHAYQLQDKGLDTVEANEELGFAADLRDYGVGAQILRHLGLRNLRLMTNNPRKVVGLEGHDLKVTERVPIVCEPGKHNEFYLATKKAKLGHLL